MERREKHLFLYQGQLWRLISQFAMTEPYLFWKIVSMHVVFKWKLPLSGEPLRLCAQVLLVCICTSFLLCGFARVNRCVLFVVPRTCVFCRTWALSVSRSCPPCQISGIYKSRQWKTDHQASSCHTSILPRASKDSHQHALLIPMLLQTKFSAACHWFILGCCGRASVWSQWGWWCLQSCVYLQRYNFVLFEFQLSLVPLWMTLSPVYSAYISCGALSATSSWFRLCLFAYFCAPLCVWRWLRVLGRVGYWEKIVFKIFVPKLDLNSNRNILNTKEMLICFIVNKSDIKIRK